MFRFFNSGLKPSVITFPNSICHSSNLHKKINDEDNENKKLSVLPHTVFIYKIVQQNSHFIYLQNLNLFIGKYLFIPHNFQLTRPEIRSLENHQCSTLLRNSPQFSLSKLVISFSDSKITKEEDCPTESKSKKILSLSNDRAENNKRKSCQQNKNNATKDISDELREKFNRFGHDLNVKGCDTVDRVDKSTALQYWKCAAAINYPPAQFNLGAFYQSNNDLNKAEQWYRLAVKCGNHPIAAYNLALLLNDKNIDSLREEIKELLTLSAEQGCTEAISCIQCINDS